MNDQSLKNVIQNLEDLFEVFNSKYFNGELVRPVITVSPDTMKVKSFGWCTEYKAWKNQDDSYFEINICAEHLARPYKEVAGTMLHEMVHLFNVQNNIKDTSRGGTYHNKKFKSSAEVHGLNVEENEKYGWCITSLNSESENEVEDFIQFIGKDSFELYREAHNTEKDKKGGSKSSSRKYVCPVCGTIIRATKEVHVMCADCKEMMIEEV